MTSNQIKLSSQSAIVTKAEDINRLYTVATTKLLEAADSVREIGKLLLEVKNSLKHGEFQSWVSKHCCFSIRQAQRYMHVAENKLTPIEALTLKNDTMSHLKTASTKSDGIWEDGKWKPERGCMYLFNENGSTYWILPSKDEIPHFHICKHYSGTPMSTDSFYWRYTVVADNHDPDLTSEFYVGTRFPLFGASGVADVLKSYGLKDIMGSLVFGTRTEDRFERPFGEPDSEIQYWSDDIFTVTEPEAPPTENPETEPHPTGTPAS